MSLFVAVVGVRFAGIVIEQAAEACRHAVVDVVPVEVVTAPAERAVIHAGEPI